MFEGRAFILQSTTRGNAVWLLGRLEDGRRFLVRDATMTPHFFVRSDSPNTSLRTMDGDPVARVQAQTPRDWESFPAETFEGDVRLPSRFLITHGLRGSLCIRGDEKPAPHGIDVAFDNPRLTPTRWAYRPSVLSIDIETNVTTGRILSIALVGAGADEVLMDEAEPVLLRRFAQRVREIDPDVITGWNVIDFDLAELQKKGRLDLGRLPGELRVQSRGFWQSSSAHIPGRVVLDALQLMRQSFVPLEEYGLDFVARTFLGEGKTANLSPDAIVHLYTHDRDAFIAYNRRDAAAVLQLLDKLQLIALAVERSLLTGLPLDRVSGSIAAFDSLYLGALHARGFVAPSQAQASQVEATYGGLVLEPKVGLYERVCVLDFKSLYPSVIRTFAIDPLGFAQPGDDPIVAPNGAKFARTQSILPSMLDALFPEREAAKRRGDALTSQAIKILMNAFYGVLGSPQCRFHAPEIANAITAFGRELLLWTKAHIESLGHAVLYGDTDSVFVHLNGQVEPAALVAQVNAALASHIAERWRVESKLELQLDALYSKLWLQQLRQGEGGARKRYCGLLDSGELEMVGVEAVRRDWTQLAKNAQRELTRRLFLGEPVEAYLRALVFDLRAGKLDDQLVYKKSLRKPTEAYTANTPPHVAAARKLKASAGRLISYVMTKAGPEPVGARSGQPLDYAHYLDKQLRPVAEPIFEQLGLSVAPLLADDRQLRLFD